MLLETPPLARQGNTAAFKEDKWTLLRVFVLKTSCSMILSQITLMWQCPCKLCSSYQQLLHNCLFHTRKEIICVTQVQTIPCNCRAELRNLTSSSCSRNTGCTTVTTGEQESPIRSVREVSCQIISLFFKKCLLCCVCCWPFTLTFETAGGIDVARGKGSRHFLKNCVHG